MSYVSQFEVFLPWNFLPYHEANPCCRKPREDSIGWYHFPKALYGLGRDVCPGEDLSGVPDEVFRVVQALKKNARKIPSTKYLYRITFFFFFNLNTFVEFAKNSTHLVVGS